jgi:hypothetical protein
MDLELRSVIWQQLPKQWTRAGQKLLLILQVSFRCHHLPEAFGNFQEWVRAPPLSSQLACVTAPTLLGCDCLCLCSCSLWAVTHSAVSLALPQRFVQAWGRFQEQKSRITLELLKFWVSASFPNNSRLYTEVTLPDWPTPHCPPGVEGKITHQCWY